MGLSVCETSLCYVCNFLYIYNYSTTCAVLTAGIFEVSEKLNKNIKPLFFDVPERYISIFIFLLVFFLLFCILSYWVLNNEIAQEKNPQIYVNVCFWVMSTFGSFVSMVRNLTQNFKIHFSLNLSEPNFSPQNILWWKVITYTCKENLNFWEILL